MLQRRISINRCDRCGRYIKVEPHHIFGGPNRKKSEKYKNICVVHLCRDCHRALHDGKLEDYKKLIRTTAQIEFEHLYGHKKWMEEFHKNYVD